MRTITLTDDPGFVKERFPAAPAGSMFLALKDDRGAITIGQHLLSIGMKRVTRRQMQKDMGERFRDAFSNAVRSVNRLNASPAWWSMNFTNKYPILSRLCENVFAYASVIELFSAHTELDLVVITDNLALSRQLRDWSRRKGISFTDRIRLHAGAGDFIRMHTPLAIAYMFLKLSVRAMTSRALLEGPARNTQWTVAFSEFDNRSIDANGFYHEIYFRNLKQELAAVNEDAAPDFLTIGFSPYFGPLRFIKFVRRIAGRKENELIYPLEHFLQVKVLVRYFFASLMKHAFPAGFKGSFDVFGEDASVLLKHEIRKSVGSGQSLLNLSIYAAALSFAKRYKADRIYYPFENRSWEKMVVLAFRKAAPATSLAGYQHTIMTPKHLCYFLEKGEYGEVPMPDSIITVGEVTRDTLRRWNFPPEALIAGCSLRVQAQTGRQQARRTPIKEILVVMAYGRDEYVKMLMFLDSAFGGAGGYDIVLRPHPAISLDAAFDIYRPSRVRYRISGSPLHEDLERCDLVLYASSTVSLEAVAMGKPAIFIELDDFLDSDPMFNMDSLKWRCAAPAKLKDIIGEIDSLREDEISELRAKAAAYAKKYFYPVNKDNVAVFCRR